MPGLTRDGDNPLGEIGRYLAGTGNLMLAGAIGLSYGLRAHQDEPGLLVTAISALVGALVGFQGLAAMYRFVQTAPNRARATAVATATGLFALFAGGLFGVVAISIIGKVVFSG